MFDNIKKKFGKYIILMFSLIIFFVILNISITKEEMTIDLLGDITYKANNLVVKKGNEYYLKYNYVKNKIDNEIYLDTVSNKVVISSDTGLLKSKVNTNVVSLNYEDIKLNNVGIIEKEEKYISLELLKLAYGLETTLYKNTIYIYEQDTQVECKITSNHIPVRVESVLSSNVVDYVDKKDKIFAVYERENSVFIKTESKAGYISKKVAKYLLKEKETIASVQNNIVYAFADSSNLNLESSRQVDIVMFNMFGITKTTGAVNDKKADKNIIENVKKNGKKVYGIATNEYNLASFTASTMSQVLADETKRHEVINNLNLKIKEYKIDGIVFDFRSLKKNDIQNYIQFVKEVKAFCGKQVGIILASNEYKNYLDAVNYSDFAIVNAFGQRDLKSSVSGSVAEIKWTRDIIGNVLAKANPNKVVMGLPCYSILWTEKNSVVVDSEIYNLKAIEDYVTRNKVTSKDVGGQNYIEIKKGSLVYRMWIEDELSIKNRIQIAKDNNLLGVAIYKLGYENQFMLNELKNYKQEK